MSDAVKNILFLTLALVIVGVGYYIYTNDEMGVLNVKENGQLTRNLESETTAFIEKLNVLEKVKLQTEIFDDPMFNSLRSYATPVPELEVGRENPFRSVLSE